MIVATFMTNMCINNFIGDARAFAMLMGLQ